MPNAYSYVRMSTDMQLLGDSLRRQKQLSQAYANKHGLTLIEDFNLEDIGVSAFNGLNATEGALSRFLAAIEKGEIPNGSYLLVESLDRLSRESLLSALPLFLKILAAGVNIATLADDFVYRSGEVSTMDIMYSIMIMGRANDESIMKSKRVGAAWQAKRNQIASQKLTKNAPKWLELTADRRKFMPIRDRAKTVQRIFQLSIDGYGIGSITRKLNLEKVAPFGKSNGWNESYISKILNNPAVIGHFQPHRYINGKRQPDGDIIRDYFPPIVSEKDFYLAQSVRARRSQRASGRRGEAVANLFTHLVKCHYCGAAMRMINKGNGPKGGRYLKCSASVKGIGCNPTSWRYDHFETSFLYFSQEIDLKRVIESVSRQNAKDDLRERIAAIDAQLIDIKSKRESTFNLAIGSATDFLAKKLAEFESAILIKETELNALKRSEILREVPQVFDGPRLIENINVFRSGDPETKERNRMQLAIRLRALIDTITVATAGKIPWTDEAADALVGDAPDKASILAILREKYEQVGRYKFFQVNFKDGSARLVVVGDKPMDLIVQTSINRGEGSVAFSRPEHADHIWRVPLSDAEAKELIDDA